MYAESRSRVGHHVLYAALMHGDDVGLAFYHEHAVFLCNGLLGLIDAVELMVFLVNVGLWRVYILLCHALGARVEHASREPNHLTAYSYPRKEHAPGVAVDEFAAVGAVTKACFHEELVLVALASGCLGECHAVGEVEA